MGGKSVFKRNKIFSYFTCSSIICLFLCSCQHYTVSLPPPTSVDLKEEKHLESIQRFVECKDFKSAALENQRRLAYFNRNADMTDRVSLNYIKNAMTISHLLTQIMAEDKNKQALYAKIQSDKKQIKSLNLRIESLGQTAASQQNKIVEIDKLIEQVNTLENEKKLLQQQLNRLKEIDLTPNNIIGNTVPSE